MPVMDGVEATRGCPPSSLTSGVVALTSFAEHGRVGDVLQAGAIGYLLKDCEPVDLLAAVRSAAEGQAPIDPRVATALLPSASPTPSG